MCDLSSGLLISVRATLDERRQRLVVVRERTYLLSRHTRLYTGGRRILSWKNTFLGDALYSSPQPPPVAGRCSSASSRFLLLPRAHLPLVAVFHTLVVLLFHELQSVIHLLWAAQADHQAGIIIVGLFLLLLRCRRPGEHQARGVLIDVPVRVGRTLAVQYQISSSSLN